MTERKLHIPLIRSLDLRREGTKPETEKVIPLKPSESVSYIVYQHKGGKAA